MNSIRIVAAPGFAPSRRMPAAGPAAAPGTRAARLRAVLLHGRRGAVDGGTRAGAPHRELPAPFC